jgi:hypothetical protein
MPDQIPHKLIYERENEPLPGFYQRIKYESSDNKVEGGAISNIFIPGRARNTFLFCRNSCLNFTMRGVDLVGTGLPAAGTADNQDNLLLSPLSMAACIKTLSVISNGKPVCQIDDYSKIASMLLVATASTAGGGIRSLLTGSSYVNGYDNTLIGNPTSAYGVPETGSTATKTTTPYMSFSIPLFGLLGSSVIPINELEGSLQIQITWNQKIREVFHVNPGTITLSDTGGKLEFTNVSYEAATRTLTDAAYKLVAEENNFGSKHIEWSDTHYYLTSQEIPATTLTSATRINTIVPSMKFTSLDALYNGTFVNAGGGNDASEPVNLPHLIWDECRFRVGGIEKPTNTMTTLSEYVNQTIACTSNVNQATSLTLMNSKYTAQNFRPIVLVTQTTARKYNDRGVLGINLRSFPEIETVSGIDSRFTTVQFEATTKAIANASETPRGMNTCWVAQYSVVYVINDGVLSMASD